MAKQQERHNRVKEIEIKALGTFHKPMIAKRGSIGYDLVVPEDFTVAAYSRTIVPLNFALNLPLGVEAKIEPRSGFSLKGMEGYGRKSVNCKLWGFVPYRKVISGKLRFNADVLVGKIDPNYTDNIHVIIKNDDVEFVLKAGTRIAQLTFYNTVSPYFKEVSELSCKSRGGGFGSTGTNINKQ